MLCTSHDSRACHTALLWRMQRSLARLSSVQTGPCVTRAHATACMQATLAAQVAALVSQADGLRGDVAALQATPRQVRAACACARLKTHLQQLANLPCSAGWQHSGQRVSNEMAASPAAKRRLSACRRRPAAGQREGLRRKLGTRAAQPLTA